MMKRKLIWKWNIFILIGIILFSLIQSVLVEKNSYDKYRAWKNLDDVDILILGNSHADCGFRADNMSTDICAEELSVFNYAIYGMRIEQMYYFTKEVLKTHVPDLIILETFAFCPLTDEDREVLTRRAFDVFPLNRNKFEAINYCMPEADASFYIPFIKYHSRWKELSPYDFHVLYNDSLWPTCGGNGSYTEEVCADPGDGWFQQEIPAIYETRALTPSEKDSLDKLLKLAEENNIQLLFVSVPFKIQAGLDSIEQIKINNFLQANYVNDDHIKLLDMNRLWQELDFDYDDLMNEGHVNSQGADKVTAYLIEYLKANYIFA